VQLASGNAGSGGHTAAGTVGVGLTDGEGETLGLGETDGLALGLTDGLALGDVVGGANTSRHVRSHVRCEEVSGRGSSRRATQAALIAA